MDYLNLSAGDDEAVALYRFSVLIKSLHNPNDPWLNELLCVMYKLVETAMGLLADYQKAPQDLKLLFSELYVDTLDDLMVCRDELKQHNISFLLN